MTHVFHSLPQLLNKGLSKGTGALIGMALATQVLALDINHPAREAGENTIIAETASERHTELRSTVSETQKAYESLRAQIFGGNHFEAARLAILQGHSPQGEICFASFYESENSVSIDVSNSEAKNAMSFVSFSLYKKLSEAQIKVSITQDPDGLGGSANIEAGILRADTKAARHTGSVVIENDPKAETQGLSALQKVSVVSQYGMDKARRATCGQLTEIATITPQQYAQLGVATIAEFIKKNPQYGSQQEMQERLKVRETSCTPVGDHKVECQYPLGTDRTDDTLRVVYSTDGHSLLQILTMDYENGC